MIMRQQRKWKCNKKAWYDAEQWCLNVKEWRKEAIR